MKLFFMRILIILFALSFISATDSFSKSLPDSAPKTQLNKNPAGKPIQQPPVHHEAPRPLEKPVGQQATFNFTEPGIVAFQEGEWRGMDYLANLQKDLRLVIEIVKAPNDSLSINEQTIEPIILDKLQKTGLSLSTTFFNNEPPQPYLHCLIIVNKIADKGYAACCSLRLFEITALTRPQVSQEITFQSITWEKQNLIIAPKETALELVKNSIAELAQGFVERYQFFERRAPAIQETERLRSD